MTSFSRNIAGVLGIALLVLPACAPQTQTVPEVALPAPTKDIWQAAAEGDITT